MKLLILGGTVFVGYHLVRSALEAGHEVTLFNRGQSNPNVWKEVEHIQGDREHDLGRLHGRKWDAVLDTCGYLPRQVQSSAEQLAESTEHYTFISSISVYRDFTQLHTGEDAPVTPLPEQDSENVRKYYGALKAASESAISRIMGERALHVRAGLIVGPQDPTRRFVYWPMRVRQGGQVLAPGSPAARQQFIDVRDLADWVIRMAEQRRGGVYNAVGPERPWKMDEIIGACMRVTGVHPDLTWVADEFLYERNIGAWSEMPLWFPQQGDFAAFRHYMEVDNRRAMAAGLSFRSLEDTLSSALHWADLSGAELQDGVVLDPDKEKALLAEWHRLNE